MSDYLIQYCADGRDITGDIYAEQDADEIRYWVENGDLIAAAEDQHDGTWRAYDDSGNEYVGSKRGVLDWMAAQVFATCADSS